MNYEILEHPSAITGFRQVIESFNDNPLIPLRKTGRYSDAFVYILSGSCSYRFADGSSFRVRKGDILYLSEGSLYEMRPAFDPEHYAFIFCDFDFAGSGHKSMAVTPADSDEFLILFRQLKKKWYTADSDRIPACMSILYRIYSQLIRCVSSSYLDRSTRKLIEQAGQTILSSLPDRSLTVAGLAESCGMSEVYFRKLFRSVYKDAPTSYILHARIRYAKELMLLRFLSLEEVALQSGFSSLPHFCKTFRKLTGLTPTAWLKEQKG